MSTPDLLNDFDWNDPASLGMPPTVIINFLYVEDFDGLHYYDGCGAKRWLLPALGCDQVFVQTPMVGREQFTLNWATLVSHSNTRTGHGGVYYTSDDGACTLEWFPCECIWNLNIVFDATDDSAGGSFNEIFRQIMALPDQTWQIPPFPLGTYDGSIVDRGSNKLICSRAEVTLPP